MYDGYWYYTHMNKIVAFLHDVKVELGRVSWPSQTQTIQYTLAVVGMSLGLALFLGILDVIFAFGLNTFLLK